MRIEADASDVAPVEPPVAPARTCPSPFDTETGLACLKDLFAQMFERASLRERYGGVHSGALVIGGRVAVVREDVSRHCVMDKLIGSAVRGGHPLSGCVALTSGRISGAIAAKAARSGLPMVATMSIPTTLAADIAGRSGVWLIGRARGPAPHVYRPGPR